MASGLWEFESPLRTMMNQGSAYIAEPFLYCCLYAVSYWIISPSTISFHPKRDRTFWKPGSGELLCLKNVHIQDALALCSVNGEVACWTGSGGEKIYCVFRLRKVHHQLWDEKCA